MSEKQAIYEKYMKMAKEELQQLQESCPHEHIIEYINHFIESSKYCLVCGKVFDIEYVAKDTPEWNNLRF